MKWYEESAKKNFRWKFALPAPYNSQKNEICQMGLKDISFNSVLYADSKFVFSFWLKALFESKNRWIPPKIGIVPVKPVSLNTGTKMKKTDP